MSIWSATDLMFCIRQIRDEKSEYSEAVRHLCIDFKKAHLVTMEILYNKLLEFYIPLKLVRLIKMC